MLSELENKFLELLRKPVKTQNEIQEMETIRERLEIELRNEIKDLISELHKEGIKYNDVWDLVNTKEPYPNAILVLIKHLSKHYHDKNKEGIIRALAVKEARGIAVPALLEEYYKIPKEKMDLRWTIGNTVEAIATIKDIDEIIKIVKDKGNGLSRQMFVMALGKFRSPKAEEALKDLLKDKEVYPFASKALKLASKRCQ